LSFIILFALANIVLAILVYNSFGWYTVLTSFWLRCSADSFLPSHDHILQAGLQANRLRQEAC
jgi:uncharacterized membrane-anchored protein YitT (DUF2179 family)